MNNTKIEWCDSTWNPVTGCLHGCEYCYARKIAERFGGYRAPDGTKTTEAFDSGVLDYALFTVRKNNKFAIASFPFGFEPTFHKYRLETPTHWKKPRAIFVCSMADLFGKWVPDEWIKSVFSACLKAPWHTYIFLTKNSARYAELKGKGLLPDRGNMWFGVSAEDHRKAKQQTRHLPSFKYSYSTFVSVEPIRGAIDFCSIPAYPSQVIIGAETGNRKEKVIPTKEDVLETARTAQLKGAYVFMKDSLIPIVGEENMIRDLRWKPRQKNEETYWHEEEKESKN